MKRIIVKKKKNRYMLSKIMQETESLFVMAVRARSHQLKLERGSFTMKQLSNEFCVERYYISLAYGNGVSNGEKREVTNIKILED